MSRSNSSNVPIRITPSRGTMSYSLFPVNSATLTPTHREKLHSNVQEIHVKHSDHCLGTCSFGALFGITCVRRIPDVLYRTTKELMQPISTRFYPWPGQLASLPSWALFWIQPNANTSISCSISLMSKPECNVTRGHALFEHLRRIALNGYRRALPPTLRCKRH